MWSSPSQPPYWVHAVLWMPVIVHPDLRVPAPRQIRAAGAAVQAQGGRGAVGVTDGPADLPAPSRLDHRLRDPVRGLIGWASGSLQRLHWKLGLIADVNRNMTPRRVTLDRSLAMPADEAQYRRVALNGHFDNAKEAYVFTTVPGAPGLSCADAVR